MDCTTGDFQKINKKGNRYGETYQYPSKKAMKKMKRTVKESINQRYLLAKNRRRIDKSSKSQNNGMEEHIIKQGMTKSGCGQ